MGRDGVLPGKFFSRLNPKTSAPDFNILFIAILTIIISLIISYQGAAELLNFGAFLAFMGVNLAALRQFFFLRPPGEKRSILSDAITPVMGFLVCFFIWISLPTPAKITGGIWLLIGLIYLFIKTRGLKQKPVKLDFKDV
jgi:putrescine importer